MKKLKDISVRELLSIEDGFYQLETPVAYAVYGEKEYVSAKQNLDYTQIESGYINFNGPISNMTMPTIGELYNVKLVFASGFTVDKEVECQKGEGSGPFDGSPFFNIALDMSGGSSEVGINCVTQGSLVGIYGSVHCVSPLEEAKTKFGHTIYVTVTGKGEASTGEISGVISVSTDTKILDGVTKVITALADDTSYYVDNIWQDGDTLEVSAMDEASGGGEDKRNIIDLPYTIDTANNSITLDDWNNIGSLIVEGNGLTITINEEFASMVSGTKTGDVYVVVNTGYYDDDDALTDVYAYLAPLPYFNPLYTDKRRGELHFSTSGLIDSY